MRSGLRKVLWLSCIAAVVLAMSLGMVLADSGNQQAKAAKGIQDEPKITKIIYPTFGNPAIAPYGGQFTIEFDPRQQNFGQAFVDLKAFEVTVTTSNTPDAADTVPALTKTLPVASFDDECSQVWPEYEYVDYQDRRVWRVTVDVPYDVPHDLYDLKVRGQKEDGSWLEDTQPHAFQPVEEYKDKFSIVHLTDIHVFGPEAFYISSAHHERDYRENPEHPEYDGAIYYQKAIAQINRMKPDFCVYTGDYIFGQQFLERNYSDQYSGWGVKTEYEHEMLWFYETTLQLDVPVYMTLGNHDGYMDDEEDWLTNWRKLFGPVYFDFDYGDYHLLALNSMDWRSVERKLTNYFGIILQPTKYKGQLRAGGDQWEASAAPPEDEYYAQLGWMRDNLKENQDAEMRICCMHHDPWKDNNSGSMWASSTGGWLEDLTGILEMGDGEGRRAGIKLMREYDVALEISGHDHSDYVGQVGYSAQYRQTADSVQTVPWSEDYSPDPLEYGNGGEVKFVNTTSTQFQNDGSTAVYPGYRRIWINDGAVESYNYQDPKYSYPWYAEKIIETGNDMADSMNLTHCTTPAIESTFAPNPPGGHNVTNTVTNELDPADEDSLKDFYIEFPMELDDSGGYYYTVTNGTFGEVYDVEDTRMCQVYTDMNPGETKNVSVNRSGTKDTDDPTGSISINNGASTTNKINVTLNLTAEDATSGVKDIMVSNRSDFVGASWEPFRTDSQPNAARPWQLLAGEEGTRTVYYKVRDMAMPANESEAYSDTIYYVPGPDPEGPRIVEVDPPKASRGDQLFVTVRGEETNFKKDDSRAIFGDDVSVGSTTVEGTQQASAYIIIDGNADQGSRDVNVVNLTPPETPYPLEGGFKVLDYAPQITSVTPASGAVGSEVTITGNFLGNTQGDSKVEFNGVEATGVTSWAYTEVKCKVPGGATTGPVKVTTESGASNELQFTVTSEVPVVPTKPSKVWYLAEGSTNGGFESWVLVQNPNDQKTNLNLAYLTPAGEVPGPGYELAANSRVSFNVADSVPDEWSVSTIVNADQPVIAERAMYWGNRQGGHDSTGVTEASKDWYLAEGSTNGGFETWVLIQNPGEADANVAFTYMTPNGEVPGPQVQLKSRTRQSINVADTIANEWSVSTRVTSDSPIIAERSMYWNNRIDGHDSIGVTGSTQTWYLAEGCTNGGFETWVLIQNPGTSDATVDLTFMTDQGEQQGPQVPVKAMSRETVNVAETVPNVWSVSTKVTSDQPVIAERAMYWNNRVGGHDSIGMPAPCTTWYLAEGSTNGGFETWVLVQNPNDEKATVRITYMTPTGEVQGPTVELEANSRDTFFVADTVNQEWSVSTMITSDEAVISERAMYWSNRAGGHDFVGVPSD